MNYIKSTLLIISSILMGIVHLHADANTEPPGTTCLRIKYTDLNIPINSTAYTSAVPVDVSSKWGLPAGSILVTPTLVNTNVNGTYMVNNNHDIVFDMSGTQPVYIKATHGHQLKELSYDMIMTPAGANYTLISTLHPSLTESAYADGYRVYNPTSVKVTTGEDFVWLSETEQNHIGYGSTTPILNSRIHLALCAPEYVLNP